MERLSRLDHRARALRTLLQETDPVMPGMLPPVSLASGPVAGTALHVPLVRRQWLRAAAIVALIASAAFLATPARARVLDWIRAALRSPVPNATMTTVQPGRVDPASVAFVPVGGELIIEIVAAGGGELWLRRHDGRSVVARALDATSRTELLVSPSGLRIGNAGGWARYEVALPEQVSRVRVRLGQDRWLEPDLDELPRVIRFGAPPVSFVESGTSRDAPPGQ
jgi:hypothetical protein